jgi:hypothetical protein
MVERNLFRAVVAPSYLLILQGIASIYCLFFPSYWSQNGAKQGSTNLPAQICLKSTRLRVAWRLNRAYPKEWGQKRRSGPNVKEGQLIGLTSLH